MIHLLITVLDCRNVAHNSAFLPTLRWYIYLSKRANRMKVSFFFKSGRGVIQNTWCVLYEQYHLWFYGIMQAVVCTMWPFEWENENVFHRKQKKHQPSASRPAKKLLTLAFSIRAVYGDRNMLNWTPLSKNKIQNLFRTHNNRVNNIWESRLTRKIYNNDALIS